MEALIEVLPVKGGEVFLRSMFEPLGYLESPLSLNDQRHGAVMAALRSVGAKHLRSSETTSSGDGATVRGLPDCFSRKICSAGAVIVVVLTFQPDGCLGKKIRVACRRPGFN